MTAQHAHSSGGGSAGRAIVLVAVAIALGVFLLARGFDGAEDTSASSSADGTVTQPEGTVAGSDDDDDETTTTENGPDDGESVTTSTTTTTTTVFPVVTHPPGQVKVVMANGTGVRGRASRTADVLNAEGYVTAAKNTEQNRVDESVVYYRPGYGDDAKAVASALGAPADRLAPAPGTILTLIRDPESPDDLEDFNVFVVIGGDDAIIDPVPPG